ncbi:hypothetical protein SUDANB108_07046 [Streptomyces sp. enrichment culture]|uniref:hypothetical protein n=1 Tax=Streptomyces sp. enrichment culture TaxID=1795815 RepID=UPI003F5519AB
MSDSVRSTEQQRLERLGALLSGARSGEGAGRALVQGGEYGNLLWGVMLHGADRLRQGHTPSDLERSLLDALRTVVSENEVKQWGRTYRGLVDGQGGRLPVVPEKITRLPVGQGYTFDNLKQDITGLVREAVAQPNVQVVDPFAAAAGRPEDAAFIDAMRNTRLGVTAYTRPPRGAAATAADADRQPDGGQDTTADSGGGQAAALERFDVKLELESFHVVREVGDAGGSRDEIYWTVASAGGGITVQGGGKQQPYVSQTFGGLKRGDTRPFTGPNTPFQGSSDGFLGAYIQVWEQDQSSDEWWNALKEALNKAVELIDEKLAFLDAIDMGLPTWAGIAWEIGKFFISIIDVFRNYDDLSCARMIGLNRQDLAVLTHRGHTTWAFNGDGHHTLRVKSTGPRVPFPEGTVEAVERSGSTWGVPVSLGWRSVTPPAVASHNGALHVLFVDPHHRVFWTRQESGGWRAPEQVGGDVSYHAPAVVSAHNKLYYALTGTDGGVYWRTLSGTTWSNITRFSGYETGLAPSLGVHNNWVWLTHLSTGGKPCHNVSDGNGWGRNYASNLGWLLNKPVSTASAFGWIWQAATGTQRSTYFSVSTEPSQWGERYVQSNWNSHHAPALTAHAGHLWYFMRDPGNGTLKSSTLVRHDAGWSNLDTIPHAQPQDQPAAISHNNKLYAFYRS